MIFRTFQKKVLLLNQPTNYLKRPRHLFRRISISRWFLKELYCCRWSFGTKMPVVPFPIFSRLSEILILSHLGQTNIKCPFLKACNLFMRMRSWNVLNAEDICEALLVYSPCDLSCHEERKMFIVFLTSDEGWDRGWKLHLHNNSVKLHFYEIFCYTHS